VAYGLMTQELDPAIHGIRSFVSVQKRAGDCVPDYCVGSENRKINGLPLLQQGQKIGCFG